MALALGALLLTTRATAEDSFFGIERDPSGLGLVLPGSLWVSGDLTLTGVLPEGGPAEGEIDDLSLLARWEPLSRLALFGELRFENLLAVVEDVGVVAGPGEVVVERLYAEGLLTPALSLRAGKVFTPFGLWNVISRAPLTWTVEEPAIIEGSFPRRATGLSLLYQTTWKGWSLDGTVYGPTQDEIAFQSREDMGWLVGGRVAAGRDVGPVFAALGLNAAGFRRFDNSEWDTASGLDFSAFVAGHEITSELIFRVPTGPGRSRYGLYVQDAIPLPLIKGLYGLLRFEYFQPKRGGAALGQLVGLFWRPTPNVILKADYLFGTRRLENFEPGFQASFSLLF